MSPNATFMKKYVTAIRRMRPEIDDIAQSAEYLPLAAQEPVELLVKVQDDLQKATKLWQSTCHPPPSTRSWYDLSMLLKPSTKLPEFCKKSPNMHKFRVDILLDQMIAIQKKFDVIVDKYTNVTQSLSTLERYFQRLLLLAFGRNTADTYRSFDDPRNISRGLSPVAARIAITETIPLIRNMQKQKHIS